MVDYTLAEGWYIISLEHEESRRYNDQISDLLEDIYNFKQEILDTSIILVRAYINVLLNRTRELANVMKNNTSVCHSCLLT